MSVCTRCGHELDPASVGRFCTNCGQPIGVPADDDWRTDTAERPVVPAAPPSPHTAPLEPARYPLYADEVGGAAGPAEAGPAVPPSAPPPPPLPTPDQIAPEPVPPGDTGGTGRMPWWPWLLVAALLVVVAFLGFRLLLGGSDDTAPAAEETTQSQQGPGKQPTKKPTDEPSKQSEPDKNGKPGKAGDVAGDAEIDVPATAPPNEDVNGNTVTYEAANMVDGKADTCWRMPGDGTGSTITFTLPQETEVREVGMINGYAKTAGSLDWYAGNRRVLKATWEFDDGTVIEQDLTETRDLQTLQLDPVTTRTVRLTLTEVSKPGSGPEARNYTAISEVELVGTPQ